ncbi:MAG TPA: tripartite tricarboxylate transporter substrate-binding protein [Casimicrobiaceae bacterium]|nr:tripartite tricarboxylate transporter substrate-binding protein [Casimicrobiaceae bacterium]
MMRILVAMLPLLVSVASTAAWGQDNWPTKPVKLVVPSSPGGGTDVFARLLAQALSDSLKQQFLVENKPGASGNIGSEAVARAAPDGYTFLVSANAALAINPVLQKNISFDVDRDLTTVSRGVMAVNVLVVESSTGAKTLRDFIVLAKKQTGGLAFGSAGTGTSPYLGVRKLEEAADVKFLHAPYKGVAPAYQDLIGARLQFMYTDLASVIPYVKSGKVVPLAVDRKTSLLPQVPTFAEAGLAGFEAPTSFSVMAPAGVPRPIVQRLAAEVGKALKTIAPRLEQQALVPVYDTPEQFAASLKAERASWARVIQRQGITADE